MGTEQEVVFWVNAMHMRCAIVVENILWCRKSHMRLKLPVDSPSVDSRADGPLQE